MSERTPPNVDLPVPLDPRELGKRLRAARERSGRNQADLASSLGVARTTLVAIEKGERRVRPHELIELAKILELPVSDLLQREVPEESFAVQLRGWWQAGGPIDAALLPAINELERLCEDYRRLEDVRRAPLRRRYPLVYEIDGLDPERAAEDVATEERRRLGLGDGPVHGLREVLEVDVGLRVFLVTMPSGVAGMYAYTESLGGCIGVNAEHPAERSRHTMVHEYGHFLTTRSRFEVLKEERPLRLSAGERFAEAFARAFLMPASGLRRRFLDLQRERRAGVSRGDLLRIASFYAVSAEAMVRRLEELSLIPSGVWERLRGEGLEIREAQKLLGLALVDRDDLLPARFFTLAIEAWEAGELSEGQVARMLRKSRLDARKLLQEARQRGGESEALDLAAPLVGSRVGEPR